MIFLHSEKKQGPVALVREALARAQSGWTEKDVQGMCIGVCGPVINNESVDLIALPGWKFTREHFFSQFPNAPASSLLVPFDCSFPSLSFLIFIYLLLHVGH